MYETLHMLRHTAECSFFLSPVWGVNPQALLRYQMHSRLNMPQQRYKEISVEFLWLTVSHLGLQGRVKRTHPEYLIPSVLDKGVFVGLMRRCSNNETGP